MLQTAQVWLEAGKNGEAAKVFELLTRSHGNNEEAWKGLILSLHKQGAYQQAAEAMRNIPDEPAATLSGDAGYVAVAAAVYKETGNTEDALGFLRKATERFVAEGKSVPPALTIQLGWMLLDVPGRERESSFFFETPAAGMTCQSKIARQWMRSGPPGCCDRPMPLRRRGTCRKRSRFWKLASE